MIRSEKRYRELEEILKKGNTILVAKTVKSLRGEEPFEGAIGLLARYYDRSAEKADKNVIEDFFNDIKYQAVRPEIIAEIRKPYKPDTINMLIASCWQSGLNYSEYIEDIVRIFLEGDYATAIECMTLIEESVKSNTTEERQRVIKIIENSPAAFTQERDSLTRELISILGE